MLRWVEVLHEGRWLPAQLLHACRKSDGAWRGVVRYTVVPGMTYEQGRDEDELRAALADWPGQGS